VKALKVGIYKWHRTNLMETSFEYYYIVASVNNITEIVINTIGEKDYYTERAYNIPSIGKSIRIKSAESKFLIKALLSYKCLD